MVKPFSLLLFLSLFSSGSMIMDDVSFYITHLGFGILRGFLEFRILVECSGFLNLFRQLYVLLGSGLAFR